MVTHKVAWVVSKNPSVHQLVNRAENYIGRETSADIPAEPSQFLPLLHDVIQETQILAEFTMGELVHKLPRMSRLDLENVRQ